MAYAYTQTPGNGSNRLFTVAFPFIVRAHVKVYLNYDVAAGTGTQLVDGTGFSWLSDTQIQTTIAPALGMTLTVIRKTPNGSQLVVWAPGSPPTPADLNTADLQSLYVIQEQADLTEAAVLTATAAAATANAAAAAVTGALLYQPVANVASIPASPVVGQRIEISNTTGLGTYSPVAGRPAGFVGSSGVKARLIYGTPTAAAWNWIDYFPVDPDGRYATIAATNAAQTTATNAGAAATAAQTTANNAATAAAAAGAAATSAGTAAAGAQTTATNAATAATTAQTAAANAATAAAAAQALAERAPALGTAKAWNWNGQANNTFIDFTDIPSWVKRVTVMFQEVSTNGASPLTIRLGTSGGFVSNNYFSANSRTTGYGASTAGFRLAETMGSALIAAHGLAIISNVNSNGWVFSANLALSEGAASSSAAGSISAANLGGVLDRIRITTDGGINTFDSGIINVMYE